MTGYPPAGPAPSVHQLVVVANRLPVEEVSDPDGGARWERSPGGLVTALYPIASQRGGCWLGWSGTAGPAPEPWRDGGVWLHPVGLSTHEIDNYYEGQSNATIWPLYHDAVEQPVFHRRWRDAYRLVNRRFAAAAARLAGPGATVWVHDYHLQLVPGLLRALRPDLRIGFFLHIPFPPVELFCRLPLRAEIMRGLLGADLIGFQHAVAMQNFLRVADHLLGVRNRGRHLRWHGRTVAVGAFPASIDVDEIEQRATDPAVRARAALIRAELGDPRTVVLGVDRLDYTKGIEHRLVAFSELLADSRLDPADAVFVQVAVPSRQRIRQYQELRERVEREVGRINGQHAQVGRSVVHYLHRSYPRDELVALYLAADVMAVTPLRDGMNLVAKEYLAARTDGSGALLLSEFAGAAAELRHAYLVNPHDIDQFKDRFVQAVHAPAVEQRRRIRTMRRHLKQYDIGRWADAFLSALDPPVVPLPLPRRPHADRPDGGGVPDARRG